MVTTVLVIGLADSCVDNCFVLLYKLCSISDLVNMTYAQHVMSALRVLGMPCNFHWFSAILPTLHILVKLDSTPLQQL